MVQHEKNGLLVGFFDVDGFVAHAEKVLDAPQQFRPLGAAGVELIRRQYSMEVCLPKMLELYQQTLSAYSSRDG